jgi:hypothetical protein
MAPTGVGRRPWLANNWTNSAWIINIYVEADAAASAWVKQQNNGKEKKPTIDIDGDVITSPSPNELEAALRKKQLI